jgi:hypothetical protein
MPKIAKNIKKIKSKKPALVLKPKKKPSHLPTKTTSQKNTAAYYHCLASQSQKGLKPSLTKCCQDCKKNSQVLAKTRQQEINKIKNS